MTFYPIISLSQKELFLSDNNLTTDHRTSSWFHSENPIPYIKSYDSFKKYAECKTSSVMDRVLNRLQYIIQKHEILRTEIIYKNKIYQQYVSPTSTLLLREIIVDERWNLNETIGDLRYPILYTMTDRDGYCLHRFDIHHCYIDKTGMMTLKKIFHSTEDIIPSLQYIDWCNYEQKNIIELPYNFISSDYELDLPYDRILTKTSTQSHLTVELSHSIGTCIVQYRITPYILFNSIMSILLYFICKQSTIVLGSSLLNRPLAHFDDMIGLFAKSIANKYILSDSNTFQEHIQQVSNEITSHVRNSNTHYHCTKNILGCMLDLTSPESMSYEERDGESCRYSLHVSYHKSKTNSYMHLFYSQEMFDISSILYISKCVQYLYDRLEKNVFCTTTSIVDILYHLQYISGTSSNIPASITHLWYDKKSKDQDLNIF